MLEIKGFQAFFFFNGTRSPVELCNFYATHLLARVKHFLPMSKTGQNRVSAGFDQFYFVR